ncbi:Ca-activated chloride channel family protein [Propionibacteriaceae bacterium ES.041]|nr:Ca-activated chloride channel family protein [Propionibacteriaceae bacterium ES.041]
MPVPPLARFALAPIAALSLTLLAGCSGQTASPSIGAAAPERGPVDRAPQTAPVAPPETRSGDVRPIPPSRPPTGPPRTNPSVDPRSDNRSTFALDVDTGSWTRARAQLSNDRRPDRSQVRTEEFVNSFEQGYRRPADGLAVQIDGTAVPAFESPRTRVLRVGVQAAEQDPRTRPPANLTFVIDVSGSMAPPERLGLVKSSLHQLVGALRPDDTVGIVVYSDNTRVVLGPTRAARADRIRGVIDDLRTEGSTNVEAGLALGYEQALAQRREGALNRVVLLSDGVANVGNTGPEAILQTIGKAAQQRIDLVTVGFGLDPYNDTLMEQLADRGNGFHAYVDDEIEARRIFVQRLASTLVVTARDAKAQVSFDPDQVESYRLLGYENRDVADEDFRDDSVDGGEVGAGHSVTALYEVTLRPGGVPVRPLATATIRYQHPDTRAPIERSAELNALQLAQSPAQASPGLQQSIAVAELAESLRGTGWAARRTPAAVAADCAAVAARIGAPASAELADLARRAAG